MDLCDFGKKSRAKQESGLTTVRLKRDPPVHQMLEHMAYQNIHSWDLLWWDITEECPPTCWEWWEAKEPQSNMVPPESKVWVDLWHFLPETLTELEELMQEEETRNLPETSKDGWRHSNPRLPGVVEFPRWIMLAMSGMGGYQHIHFWGVPKEKRLLEQFEAEDATMEANDPGTDN